MPTKVSRMSLLLCTFCPFIDLLSLTIVLPIIPKLLTEWGKGSVELGFVFAAFAGSQIPAMAVGGWISDRVGRRPLILLSFIGTSSGFLIQSLATNYTMFLISRVVQGIFGGTMPICTAYMADISTLEERPKYITRLQACCALGFMIGPTIGAFLSLVSMQTPMYVSAIICSLAFILGLFFLEESLEGKTKTKQEDGKEDGNERRMSLGDHLLTPLTATKGSEPLYKNKIVRYLWCCFFGYGCNLILYGSMFGLLILDRFGWGPLEFGIFATCFGLLSIVWQVVFFHMGLDYVKKNKLAIDATSAKHRLVLFAGIFTSFTIALVPIDWKGTGTFNQTNTTSNSTGVSVNADSLLLDKIIMVVALTLWMMGGNTIGPGMITALTDHAGNRQGEAIGAGEAFQGIARAIMPPIYGILYKWRKEAPFFLVAGINIFIFFAVWRCDDLYVKKCKSSITPVQDDKDQNPNLNYSRRSSRRVGFIENAT